MAGIVFFKTKKLEELKKFYVSGVGMEVWLEQADCVIFKHQNMLVGFCS